jgi:hypothetical protein
MAANAWSLPATMTFTSPREDGMANSGCPPSMAFATTKTTKRIRSPADNPHLTKRATIDQLWPRDRFHLVARFSHPAMSILLLRRCNIHAS